MRCFETIAAHLILVLVTLLDVFHRKLQLKPRSVPLVDDSKLPASPRTPRRRVKTLSSKGDPFGNAVPREQVLQSRGIDPALMDKRIDDKIRLSHNFTAQQDIELESVRGELAKLQADWTDAKEKELPEEELRLKVEAKRSELHDLMEKFSKMNARVPESSTLDHRLDTSGHLHPSRRRRSSGGRQERA